MITAGIPSTMFGIGVDTDPPVTVGKYSNAQMKKEAKFPMANALGIHKRRRNANNVIFSTPSIASVSITGNNGHNGTTSMSKTAL
jgi:hypothetical protein